MPITLLVLLHLAQPTDTIGLRAAYVQAIRAVVDSASAADSWTRSVEHVVVDVSSFTAVAGLDETQAARWTSLVAAAGQRGVSAGDNRCGQQDDKCPVIRALRLESSIDGIRLIVHVESLRSSGKRRGAVAEYGVFLARHGNSYTVSSVKLIQMT